jgi:hypothetical protein
VRERAELVIFQLFCGVGRYEALRTEGQWPNPIAVLQRHIMWLEVPQERHQFDVVLPVRFGSRSTHFASFESLGLHFQVHFRIDICRVERDMPQPGTNGIDVDPGNGVDGSPSCGDYSGPGIVAQIMETTLAAGATLAMQTRMFSDLLERPFELVDGNWLRAAVKEKRSSGRVE